MSNKPVGFRGQLAFGALVAVVTGTAFIAGQAKNKLPNGWPDLTVLTDYPNPYGDECSVEGMYRTGQVASGAKGESNRLKNRFIPAEEYEPITHDEFLELPNKDDKKTRARAVELIAYVQNVKPGGTAGESCNCYAKGRDLADTHIDLTDRPNSTGHERTIVAETTERIRRLGKLGKITLKSPRGNSSDLSTKSLRDRMLGRWVKVRGWLFYDIEHRGEDFVTNPKDPKGKNWRATCWEIHPVMEIEVLNGKPNDLSTMKRN